MIPPCCASPTLACSSTAGVHRQFDVKVAAGAIKGPPLLTTRNP
jgi:hypothetical protein